MVKVATTSLQNYPKETTLYLFNFEKKDTESLRNSVINHVNRSSLISLMRGFGKSRETGGHYRRKKLLVPFIIRDRREKRFSPLDPILGTRHTRPAEEA